MYILYIYIYIHTYIHMHAGLMVRPTSTYVQRTISDIRATYCTWMRLHLQVISRCSWPPLHLSLASRTGGRDRGFGTRGSPPFCEDEAGLVAVAMALEEAGFDPGPKANPQKVSSYTHVRTCPVPRDKQWACMEPMFATWLPPVMVLP